jgi:hypothetical protein
MPVVHISGPLIIPLSDPIVGPYILEYLFAVLESMDLQPTPSEFNICGVYLSASYLLPDWFDNKDNDNENQYPEGTFMDINYRPEQVLWPACWLVYQNNQDEDQLPLRLGSVEYSVCLVDLRESSPPKQQQRNGNRCCKG